MRTFLYGALLVGALAVASGLAAAPYVPNGSEGITHILATEGDITLVQQRRRAYRGALAPSFGPRVRLDSYRPRAPRSRVLSGSVLRDRRGRPVKTRSGHPAGSGGGPDIGPGRAVMSAQSYLQGTVLGVRRQGSVYNVKILDRNRVRIIPVNAATGKVMR